MLLVQPGQRPGRNRRGLPRQRSRPGLHLPVTGIHRPQHDPLAARGGHPGHRLRQVPARWAEEARPVPGDPGHHGRGARHLPTQEAGRPAAPDLPGEPVIPGMVRDQVPFLRGPGHRSGVVGHLPADDEEGRGHVPGGEHREHPRGLRPRPVVEGEGHRPARPGSPGQRSGPDRHRRTPGGGRGPCRGGGRGRRSDHRRGRGRGRQADTGQGGTVDRHRIGCGYGCPARRRPLDRARRSHRRGGQADQDRGEHHPPAPYPPDHAAHPRIVPFADHSTTTGCPRTGRNNPILVKHSNAARPEANPFR